MRRLLPLLGLILLLLLAGAAAWLVLGGGSEDARPEPQGSDPDEAHATGLAGDRGSHDRNRASAPGRVRGAVRLLAQDLPATGVTVELAMAGDERLTARTDADGRFALSGVPSGEPFDLVIAHDDLAPVLLRGLLVQPRTTLDVGTLYLASGVPVVVRVRTTDGGPLAGATAAAYVSGEGTATFDLPHAAGAVSTAVTDANGEARFPALPPGAWTLTAQKPSFARRGLPSVTVRAAAEEERFTIVLERGYTLTGSVLDRDGNPVADAPMLAIRRTLTSNASTAPLAVRTTSGADGRYRLDNLPGQDMIVWAGWPGGRLAILAAVRLPNLREFDVVLERGGRLEGRITAEDGATPVAGATVSASLTVLDSFSMSFEDVTDEDGEYALDFPMPGAVTGLSAAARGHGYGEPSLGSDGEILIPEGLVTRRDFSLAAGHLVTGTVRGPDGPVAGADIGATSHTWWSEAKTDAAGRYELTGLAKARYVILASRPGLVMPDRPGNPDADLENGTAPARYVADLTTGEPVVIDFELLAGPGLPGRVVDEDGDPVAGATLAATGQGAGGATTDADGRFVINASEPANAYSVSVAHPGFRTEWVEVPSVVAGNEPEPLLVRLSRAPVVRGMVTDASGRVPDGTYVQIVPWSQDLRDPTNEEWSWLSVARHAVGRDGRFEQRLIDESGDRIVVRAGAPGYAFATSGALRAQGEAALEVALLLSPGVSIKGRVEDADGAPVPRAPVAATATAPGNGPDNAWYPGAWGSPIVAVCDDEGRFTLPALREGRYILRSWSRQHREAHVAADAPSDDVVIRLGASLVIAGRATMTDGTPAAGARVAVHADADGEWLETRVADDGSFRIERLSAGTHSVTLSPAPDARQNLQTTSIDDVPAGTRDLDIRAEPGRILRGLVVAADGRMLGDAGMSLVRDGDQITDVALGADGRFEVAGLDDGGYVLTIWSDALGGAGNAEFTNVRATGEEQRLVLPAPVMLRGLLVGPDGGPLPAIDLAFAVEKTDAGARIQPWELGAETDQDGRFEIPAASGVTYRAYLGSHPTLTLTGETALRAGRGETRLAAGLGASIAGQVLDEAGAPIANADVWASRHNHHRSATTDAEGRFVLTGLDEGQAYTINANKDGYLPTDAASGTPGNEVELRLERGMPLAGRVVDRAGEPYGDVQIQAIRQPDGDGTWGGWIGSDGHFDFGVLPRGRYEIRVSDLSGEDVPCGVVESGATDVIVHLPR